MLLTANQSRLLVGLAYKVRFQHGLSVRSWAMFCAPHWVIRGWMGVRDLWRYESVTNLGFEYDTRTQSTSDGAALYVIRQ